MAGDYRSLKTELLKPDLAGLSHAAAAAKLNADVVTGSRPIPLGELESLTIRRGVTARLVGARRSGQLPAELAAVVEVVLDHLIGSRRLAEVWTTDEAWQQAVAGLLAAGLLTADDVAAVNALATVTRTRAEAIDGWGLAVTAADVAHARTLA
jgi:hypothetical protein